MNNGKITLHNETLQVEKKKGLTISTYISTHCKSLSVKSCPTRTRTYISIVYIITS